MTVETGEVVEAALVPARTGSALVTLAASAAQIREQQVVYQRLVKELLVDEDYQMIAGKAFKKKSAWRKLSLAFGVNLEIRTVTHDRDSRGRIIRTEVIARATHPNGRFADGIGSCSVFEKCCGGADVCTRAETYADSGRPTNHKHCKPDCPGWTHFSHAEHDVPATAATRSTNRAAADLFAAGEVSAEEMSDAGSAGQASRSGEQRSRDSRDVTRSAIAEATKAQRGYVLNIAAKANPDNQALEAEVTECRTWAEHPAEGEWPVTDALDAWLVTRLGLPKGEATFVGLSKAQASKVISGSSGNGTASGGRTRSVPNEPPEDEEPF
jgi:hypothetical protein